MLRSQSRLGHCVLDPSETLGLVSVVHEFQDCFKRGLGACKCGRGLVMKSCRAIGPDLPNPMLVSSESLGNLSSVKMKLLVFSWYDPMGSLLFLEEGMNTASPPLT